MREIIFRGKTNDGRFLEGDLAQIDGETFIFPRDGSTDSPDRYQVDPDTVGMFTSKTYDEGKKVWENDLFEVKMNGTDTHIEYFNCQVVWHKGCAAFIFKVLEGDNSILWIAFNNEHILSIKHLGNIHDPETCKTEKE